MANTEESILLSHGTRGKNVTPTASKAPKPREVKRYIKREVERELWARAAGRCQFNGCNRLVYKSPITQEPVNISEKAHIYSFSKDGPRGWGPLKMYLGALNETQNLLLLCHDCHKTIDNGVRYDASLLIKWKEEHEKRIAVVTGIKPINKSYVVLYGANIDGGNSVLQSEHAKFSLFPNWHPAEEHPIRLDMSWEGSDDDPKYWEVEEDNLACRFERQIRRLISDGCHLSIFGLAPIPLLIRLGTLFTDKVPSQVYQLHREPERTWRWDDETCHTEYIVHEPSSFSGSPVLIISLSATIGRERITSVLGTDVSIWELTIDNPHNDFLKTIDQLSKFRESCRKIMVRIAQKHGIDTPLSIFPAMPVACAIDLGRIRMPKAEMPWLIYDQNNRLSSFIKAIEIGGIHK